MSGLPPGILPVSGQAPCGHFQQVIRFPGALSKPDAPVPCAMPDCPHGFEGFKLVVPALPSNFTLTAYDSVTAPLPIVNRTFRRYHAPGSPCFWWQDDSLAFTWNYSYGLNEIQASLKSHYAEGAATQIAIVDEMSGLEALDSSAAGWSK